MVARQVNAPLGTHLGIAVGVQHVGGQCAGVMEELHTTETEFVYPMINAFPVLCGRELVLFREKEWKGNAAMALLIVKHIHHFTGRIIVFAEDKSFGVEEDG